MISYLIKLIHIIVVLFLVFAPIFGDEYFLTMHLIVVPFILLHWITNQSVCALTEMEKIVTGKTCDDETFFGQVVGPIYKFKTKGEENIFVWTLMITLWFITFMRLQPTHFSQLRRDFAALRRIFNI